ncbi:MAG: SDR family oxidoreductase [Bacteriovoracaceae bacterium]|nr:SDR family oxidoreductase [Bacteriovoracaceae bacterium]
MKNIVIIGASHGIGASILTKLSGHQVFPFSRSETPPFDVLTQDLPLDGLPEVIDGVVYCPGSINLKPFHLLKNEDFEMEWQLNFMGAVKVLRTLYPRLKKSEMASVVLFSTVAVQNGMPYHASIAAAKGAIEGLTRSLASEWAPKIRVNAIAPSLVETPLSAKLTANAKIKEQSIEKHPLKRIGTPEDIASAAVYLLSDESSWMTGQILAVDGGMSL